MNRLSGRPKQIESYPLLEPWIHWVMVHTVLPYAEHQCSELNEVGRFRSARIWDHISKADGSVWICGSMSASILVATANTFILPDPWANEVDSAPH